MKDTDDRTGLLKLIAIAFGGGALIGCAAGALKWLIGSTAEFVTLHCDKFGGNWWLIPVALIGIMLTGLFVRKVVRIPLEFETDRIKERIKNKDGKLPARLMVAPGVASAITLGFGGSAGAEGPIAYAGAAISSNFARWVGVADRSLVTFMVCGAGAGIAAIFKAPIGGMFFAIEVLMLNMTVRELLLLIGMCLTSALTAYALGGWEPDVNYTGVLRAHPGQIGWSLLLGMLCGLYSVYYMKTGLRTRRKLQAMKGAVARNVVSGLIVGVCLFMFPALFGEGYGVLTHVMNGEMVSVFNGSVLNSFVSPRWVLLLTLTGILIVKGYATYATNSGGGVAGDFAPTLFAGGIAGALFWLFISPETMPLSVCAVAGMAAVMAGAIRAPFMAIFITVEMTEATGLFIPVALAAGASYFTARMLSPKL